MEQTNRTKLKPCPYCGNKNVSLTNWGGLYAVECFRYACNRQEARYYSSAEEALKGWEDEISERQNLSELRL